MVRRERDPEKRSWKSVKNRNKPSIKQRFQQTLNLKQSFKRTLDLNQSFKQTAKWNKASNKPEIEMSRGIGDWGRSRNWRSREIEGDRGIETEMRRGSWDEGKVEWRCSSWDARRDGRERERERVFFFFFLVSFLSIFF